AVSAHHEISIPRRIRYSATAAPNRARLLDHLVGADEQRLRHGEAERRGVLQIDHELECGRLLDRQIGRLLALEDPSGVNAALAKASGKAGSIADQAACRDELAPVVDRRNGMA